jgi:hypothetical protein
MRIAHNRTNGRSSDALIGIYEVNALGRLCVCTTTLYARAAMERGYHYRSARGLRAATSVLAVCTSKQIGVLKDFLLVFWREILQCVNMLADVWFYFFLVVLQCAFAE